MYDISIVSIIFFTLFLYNFIRLHTNVNTERIQFKVSCSIQNCLQNSLM